MTAAKRRAGGTARKEEKGRPSRSVNLEVDTPWELMENDALSRLEGLGRERFFRIRVLGKRGRKPPTEKFLDELRHDRSEFETLLVRVRGLLRSPRAEHERFCRPGRGAGKGVFEFKAAGKEFRLFFFYDEDADHGLSLVVTLGGFSKAKSSPDEQNREFARAARMRDEFLAQRGTR